LKDLWPVSPGAEITVEINPATWSGDQLRAAVDTGFNRLSIGAQSFDDGVLLTLQRQHDAAETRSLANLAAEVDGAAVSLDLIYGVPGQGLSTWLFTLQESVEFEPEHISTYALTLDPQTPLGRRVETGELSLPGEEEIAKMYEHACRTLRAAGYHHYEISNFARPGHECGHNEACWRREDYLGLGAAAHSFQAPDVRRHNLVSVDSYMEKVQQGELPLGETERLSPREEWEEEVLLSLRTSRGLEMEALARQGVGVGESRRVLDPLLKDGLAWRRGNRCGLTERGMFVSDHIISSLLGG
jgi:oxygen-independent coproporphyrinogen-3 oxidase